MLQRVRTPTRTLRSAPRGFIRPCAPTILGRAPRGPRWIHEIKQDGYRLCCRKDGTSVAIWTRLENEVGGRFERIAAMLRALPGGSCTIDGEAIVRRPDGHSDFHALRSRVGAAEAMLVAFDLVEIEGQDLRREPLEVRRTRLAALIDRHATACGGEPDPAILFSIAFAEDGPEVFAQACALGCEGVVSKRVGSIYRSGNSAGDWVKTLNPGYRRP